MNEENSTGIVSPRQISAPEITTITRFSCYRGENEEKNHIQSDRNARSDIIFIASQEFLNF